MIFNLMRIFVATLIVMPLAGQAARPLGPPIAEFFKNENRIACGLVAEKLTGSNVVIRVDTYLSKSDAELVSLNVDADVLADLEVGTRYVFVFSRLRKNALVRDEWELNPDGPALVKTRGLGTAAIYVKNAAIQILLTPPGRRDTLSLPAETSLLLKLAENNKDPRARELAIFELYLRNDLQGEISADSAKRYAAISMDADPGQRNFLLQGARNFPEEHRAPWLQTEFRKIISDYGTELALNSDIPLLVKNSLLGMLDDGTTDDLEMIGKHLYSNAPGVAKAALAALDAIDSLEARVAALEAVEADNIHLVTRRALITYINQNSGN